MAYKIDWSPEALDDTDEIAGFIAKDSPQYAHSVVEQILDKSRSLSENPLRGRVVSELKDSAYRELFIYSYRMIYHVNEGDGVIQIAAVIHGARLLPVERIVS